MEIKTKENKHTPKNVAKLATTPKGVMVVGLCMYRHIHKLPLAPQKVLINMVKIFDIEQLTKPKPFIFKSRLTQASEKKS